MERIKFTVDPVNGVAKFPSEYLSIVIRALRDSNLKEAPKSSFQYNKQNKDK